MMSDLPAPHGSFGLATPVVPSHAMSTRPSSPAAAHAIILCNVPSAALRGIVTGADQVLPSFVEYEYFNTTSPVILPLASDGACSHTAYRCPALSIAIDGKFPPVF